MSIVCFIMSTQDNDDKDDANEDNDLFEGFSFIGLNSGSLSWLHLYITRYHQTILQECFQTEQIVWKKYTIHSKLLTWEMSKFFDRTSLTNVMYSDRMHECIRSEYITFVRIIW